MISFDSEKCLEDLLCEHLDQGQCLVTDEMVSGYIRQPNFGPYGKGDILTVKHGPDGEIDEVCVIELKNEKLSSCHLSQISRYKSFMDRVKSKYKSLKSSFRFVLVVKDQNEFSSDLVYLAQNIEWLEIYRFNINPSEGLLFNCFGHWSPNVESELIDECIDKLNIIDLGVSDGEN